MKHTYYRLGLLLALFHLVDLASGQSLALTELNPVRNARSAPQTTNVSLTFNQSLNTNAATLNGLRVFSAQRGGLLRSGQGGSASVSGSTLSFNPTTNFKPGETVYVTSTSAIQGTGGARLSRGQVYQFTSGVGGTGQGNYIAPATNPESGVGVGPLSVALGDVDGDGDLDLLTANLIRSTVSVRLNRPFPLTLSGLSASPNPVCVGQPFTIRATLATLDDLSTGYSYTLTNGTSTSTGSSTSAAFSQTLVASGSGVQSFTLTVSSAGQSATATTSVTVNAPPSPTLISSGLLTCASPSITLTAGGGNSYAFSGPGGSLASIGNTVLVSVAGTYSVVVTNASGCSATATTTVTSSTALISVTNPGQTTATLGEPFSQLFTASGGRLGPIALA